jgi:hypothetical protein
MTSHPSDRPISALRASMIEDMGGAASARRRATTTFATFGHLRPLLVGRPTQRRQKICPRLI